MGSIMIVRFSSFLVVCAALAFVIACGQDPTPVVEGNDDNGMNVGQNNDSEATRGDGQSCGDDSDCFSGVCLQGDDWPGGHCTTINCDDDADCHGDDAFCMTNPEGNDFCARPCDTDGSGQCRDGYTCQDAPADPGGWCRPGEEDDPDPDPTPSNNDNNDSNNDNNDSNNGSNGDNGVNDFEIECQSSPGQQVSFDFEVSDDADSYMVVPISEGLITPLNITTPGGETINFQGQNSFQAAGAQMFGVINPTVVPAAPQFDYQFETGTNTYTLENDASEICWYVIESQDPVTTIDLNVYLVGVPGVSPDDAENDINVQNMLDETEDILAQANVEVGEVRFPEVPASAEDNYSIIRSEQDVSELIAYSEDPGDTADELVSANVFITEQFSFSGGGGALGISLGIPGAAGLHGTGISGVAMTGEYLGTAGGGNKLTAVILAHELGHFLGLFHTTEQTGTSMSPLYDVPECDNMSNPTACPDWGNLMFPSADTNNDELHPDQSFVIGVNPLTK